MVKPRSNNGGIGIAFFIFITLFWSTIVCLFDGHMIYTVYRQSQSERYPTVSGIVTDTEIDTYTTTDDDGRTTTSHEAIIKFNYEVQGRPYRSDTYRYGARTFADPARADAAINRYPKGAEVEVHYNPSNPDDAVLEVGVATGELFAFVFLTPFNLVMFWFWGFLGGHFRRKITKPPAGGAPIIKRDFVIFVRLPRYSPLTFAGMIALGISFVSVFVVGFSTGMEPPMWVIWATWACILIPALTAYFWRTFLVGSGAKDLVIDDNHESLSLPQTFGRKTDVLVPIAMIADIDVETITHHSSKGGTSFTFAPGLTWTDDAGTTRRDKLADWRSLDRAKDLVDWLKDHLRQYDR